MSTYVTTWQCRKCGAVIPTRQKNAGFIMGYGRPNSGPCPAGDSHEWHQIVEGKYIPDDRDDD
jgi:hypothetical protein